MFRKTVLIDELSIGRIQSSKERPKRLDVQVKISAHRPDSRDWSEGARIRAAEPKVAMGSKLRSNVLASAASALMLAPGCALAQADVGCVAANALFGAILGNGRQAITCKGGANPASAPSAQGPAAADRLTPDQRSALDRVVPQVRAHYESLDATAGTLRDEPCGVLLRQEWQSGRMQSLLHVGDACREQTQASRLAFEKRRTEAKQNQRAASEEARHAEVARFEAETSRKRDEYLKGELARAEAYEKLQEAQRQAWARQFAQDLRSGKRIPEGCREWLIAQGRNPEEMTAQVTRVALEPPRGAGSFWGDVLQLGKAKLFLRGHGDRYLVVSLDAKTKVFGGAEIRQGGGASGFGVQNGVEDVQMTDGSVERSAVIAATCLEPAMNSR